MDEWLGKANIISFYQEKDNQRKLLRRIKEKLLHPMIREVAVEELKPSVRNCSVLIDSLQEISLMHGLDFMNNKQVFHTVESIIAKTPAGLWAGENSGNESIKGGLFYGNGGEHMTVKLRKDSQIPAYMAYPRFLLTADVSETAKQLLEGVMA